MFTSRWSVPSFSLSEQNMNILWRKRRSFTSFQFFTHNSRIQWESLDMTERRNKWQKTFRCYTYWSYQTRRLKSCDRCVQEIEYKAGTLTWEMNQIETVALKKMKIQNLIDKDAEQTHKKNYRTARSVSTKYLDQHLGSPADDMGPERPIIASDFHHCLVPEQSQELSSMTWYPVLILQCLPLNNIFLRESLISPEQQSLHRDPREGDDWSSSATSWLSKKGSLNPEL